MGIINATPDSFYSGSKYSQEKAVLLKVEQMVAEGAAIIDIGGMSSRPGAAIITPEEEIERVSPLLRAIVKHFPTVILSIDTLHSIVAKEALEHGAHIVNDISGGRHDAAMLPLVGRYKVPYIMMHMQGTPADMQKAPAYSHVVTDVVDCLARQIKVAREVGVTDIIIDPGFGFGKTVAHNYELLMHLPLLHTLDCPILVGLSRKSMINKVIYTTPDTALNGTTVLHTLAIERGANLLRVHDVLEAKQAIQLVTAAHHYADGDR